MAVLPIIPGQDNPVLRKKNAAVPFVSKEIKKLIKDMEDTVNAADGAGLAAPQINQSIRLCLALISGQIVPLINPEIMWRSVEKEILEEGCLSLPKIWRNIERHLGIIIQYTDVKGQPQERKLTGFDARAVQHELDHLDGVLIVDYPELKINKEESKENSVL